MKSTIEISDALMARTRRYAEANGLTLKATIERGLNHLLDSKKESAPPFRLQRKSVGSGGLTDWAKGHSMSELLAASYEGRGE